MIDKRKYAVPFINSDFVGLIFYIFDDKLIREIKMSRLLGVEPKLKNIDLKYSNILYVVNHFKNLIYEATDDNLMFTGSTMDISNYRTTSIYYYMTYFKSVGNLKRLNKKEESELIDKQIKLRKKQTYIDNKYINDMNKIKSHKLEMEKLSRNRR